MVGPSPERSEPGRRNLLTALGFVIASAILLYLPARTQSAIAEALKASVLSPFISVNSALTRASDRATNFEILRTQMDSAIALLAAQRTLAEENRQLRAILELRDRSERPLLPATVIRSGMIGAESEFMLDVGRDQGIEPFMAVITNAGLLGAVQRVHGGTADAIDWSHPDFRVSAMTADGSAFGLVEPERGRFREQDRLVLQGTAFLSDLPAGTEVRTSGRGGAVPRGILVGWIGEVAEASSGWSKAYYVIPAVHPASATHALVDLGRGEGPGDPTAPAPPSGGGGG